MTSGILEHQQYRNCQRRSKYSFKFHGPEEILNEAFSPTGLLVEKFIQTNVKTYISGSMVTYLKEREIIGSRKWACCKLKSCEWLKSTNVSSLWKLHFKKR